MRIHYKLTDIHLNPDKAEKMRNHLATEVLNKDMLHLMQVFPLKRLKKITCVLSSHLINICITHTSTK